MSYAFKNWNEEVMKWLYSGFAWGASNGDYFGATLSLACVAIAPIGIDHNSNFYMVGK